MKDALTDMIDYEEGIKYYSLLLKVNGEVAGKLFEGTDKITVIRK